MRLAGRHGRQCPRTRFMAAVGSIGSRIIKENASHVFRPDRHGNILVTPVTVPPKRRLMTGVLATNGQKCGYRGGRMLSPLLSFGQINNPGLWWRQIGRATKALDWHLPSLGWWSTLWGWHCIYSFIGPGCVSMWADGFTAVG